jgi:hypothetical protein
MRIDAAHALAECAQEIRIEFDRVADASGVPRISMPHPRHPAHERNAPAFCAHRER